MKKKKPKAAVVANLIFGKVLSAFGGLFAFAFLLMVVLLVYSIARGDSYGVTASAVIGLICLIAAAPMTLKGRAIKLQIRRFRTYVNLLSISHMTALTDFAQSTQRPVDFVRADLQKMIDQKFFADAVIDMQRNELLIGGAGAESGVGGGGVRPVVEAVRCPGCGATNVKKIGATAVCEYCGSVS
ncbi:MAG: hypothetical protein LBU58_09170 [Clostridiales bacterium]|nr:hypothetical protein [Clostridiales bacterium]